MTTTVEKFLSEGCGRCSLGGTPECKVHQWTEELKLLRTIVLGSALNEESKWGVPCYTYENSNVLMISVFKNYCSISFFKGALLNDPKSLLEKPGKNTQAARIIKITNVEKIKSIATAIRDFIHQAIEVEQKGLKVNFKKNPEPIPEELEKKLEEDQVFKSAFESLTPGRQRGYIIYFSAPKQSKTRESRIEKCTAKILNGEGLHDKYSGRK